MRKRITNKIKKVVAADRKLRKNVSNMESRMRVKIRPAVGGTKAVGKRAAKAVIQPGMGNAWIKRNLSGYEKAGFKAAAKRLRKRK